MELPQIVATTPKVKPATSEVVYDKYWITGLRIDAENPLGKVRLQAEFKSARDVTVDGVTGKEIMPGAQPVNFEISDLLGEAANDAQLAQTVGAVMTLLQARASAAGIL